ncbi:MAG: XRE family transcriptional regulator [Pseudomonadota bacterium]
MPHKTKVMPPVHDPVQNPHSVDPERERNLELAIGREVRARRQAKRITVAQLSEQTGLSIGMLSKIENGVTSPSLTTLQALASALNVPLTSFFRRYEEKREVVHTKAGEGVEIVREGTRAGHQYKLLGHLSSRSDDVLVEPYLIILTDQSDRFPTFQHSGVEFIYMLEGVVNYRHGDSTFELKAGDTLFFDADAPHGPEELIDLPIRFLSVISYSDPSTA